MRKRSAQPASPAAQDWPARLRAEGLRATPASVAVLECLARSDRPLTHAALGSAAEHDHGTPIERVTLYRVLDRLVAAGLAIRYPGPDGTARFGKANAENIGHFECSACQRIVELTKPAVPPKVLEHLARQLHGQGIAIGDISLTVAGICSECSAAGHVRPLLVTTRAKA